MIAAVLLTLALGFAAGSHDPAYTRTAAWQAPAEVITQIQVHGNMLTPEGEVIRLAEIQVGMPFDATTIETVSERLEATKRFVSVDVLKRYASITDPSQIILVIVVDDGRVDVDWSTGEVKAAGGLTGRKGRHLMFLPILGFEDGYGFTYGVRFALADVIGPRSRFSVPLSLGAEKLAGVELEKNFSRGPFTRVLGGGSVSRRENPYFDDDEDRRRVFLQADRQFARPFRASVRTGWDRQSFGGRTDTYPSVGGEAAFDTRLDPVLTRNAVYARASWDRLFFGGRDALDRTELEARGYVGLFGSQVLVLRAFREDGNGPQPPYLKPLLGGMSTLRGFKAGSDIGATLVSGSVEWQVPLTSPLSVGKLGVSAFTDVATVYDDGERLSDQQFDEGVGGSVWFSAAMFRLTLAVAHGIGAGTRVHFGTGVTF